MQTYDAFGLTFHLPDKLDPIDEIIYRYTNQSQTLRYAVQPGDTIIEVGAFCGLHAMRLAQKAKPGTVLAVEMIPEFAQLCLENSNANGLNITVGAHAVGSIDGTDDALMDHHQRNSLAGGIIEYDGSSRSTMPVPVLSLDHTLEPYPVVDLLIIQTNGTELDILRTVTCWDKIRNLAVMTQYWRGGHDHKWYRPFYCPPLTSLFLSKGYEVEEIDAWVYARKTKP